MKYKKNKQKHLISFSSRKKSMFMEKEVSETQVAIILFTCLNVIALKN